MADSEQLPFTYNINLVQGDDYNLDVVVTDDAGNPIDFSTHAEEVLQVRRGPDHPLLNEYTTTGGTLTTTAGGRVTCTFAAAHTAAWPQGTRFEFQSKDGSGNVRTWIEGEITAKPEVAK